MTDFNTIVPNKPIQSFKEIADAGLMTQGLLFKLYRTGKITIIKLGNSNNVARDEIIRYLSENIIERTQ